MRRLNLMPIIPPGYGLPVAVSVTAHLLLILLVVWGWEAADPSSQKVMPRHVEATLVQIEPSSAKPAAAPKKPKVVDVAAQRREQERRRVEARAEQQRQARAQAERERKQQEAEARKRRQQQEQQEKQRQEQARLERERQAQEAREREQRRQQEAAINEALAAEEEALAARQAAVTAQSYVALMSDQVERNWNRPASARKGMTCELLITLVPTGAVINVVVAKSSGNAAFDRSAVQAVEKVGRFTGLKDMPSNVFEQYFRRFRMKFDPQDLRL